MTNYHTRRILYAEPSFLEGMARVLDLGATLQQYRSSRTEDEADMEAMRDDWVAVGEDIRVSMAVYEQQTGASKKKQRE